MKNKIVVSFFLFTLVALVAYFITTRAPLKSPGGSPTTTPYNLNSLSILDDVSPGITLGKDLSERKQPKKVFKDATGVTFQYPSTNANWSDEVYLKSDVVYFTIRRLFRPDETSFSKLSSGINELPTKLFGPDYDGGVVLYAYLRTGRALLTNDLTDTVYEEWRFVKTSLPSFLQLPQTKDYHEKPEPHSPREY